MTQETGTFTIRDLKTYDEFLQVHQIQQAVWGFADLGTGLYPPLLLTASKNGGVVLGAFGPEDQMIGYAFSFLGREPGGPLKLCSQTMGVLREWRGQGVATALKWAQRKRALAAGLSLITWTFDPLESPNARLNMHKLGAVSRCYWRDVYGEHFGALNKGLPTDRLLVEWWIRGGRVVEIETGDREGDRDRDRDRDRDGDGDRDRDRDREGDREGGGDREVAPVFEVEGRGMSRRVAAFCADLGARRLSLEVPAEIQQLKRADMSLALDWRLRVREAFETYLARGYVVTGLVTEGQGEARRNWYILQQMTEKLRDWIGVE